MEYKIRLDGEENENVSDNCILCSIIHEMYLQKIRKTTISIFDDESNYLGNIENLPWK